MTGAGTSRRNLFSGRDGGGRRRRAIVEQAAATGRTQYGLLLAGSVVVVLPVLAMFLLLQRHIMQGIAMTGIK